MFKLSCKQCHKEFAVSSSRKKTAHFCSNECRIKGLKGCIPWNKGKTHTEETKRKISIAHKGKSNLKNLAERNGMWKGENVGIRGLHQWVRKRLIKPKFCENCKKNTAYDLANKNNEYKRDLDDWWWLCRKCHMQLDGRIKNLMRWR